MPIPNNQASAPTGVASSTNDPQPHQQFASEDRPTGAGVDTGAGSTREKTSEEVEADKRYEEAMEEEYAKRDGGA